MSVDASSSASKKRRLRSFFSSLLWLRRTTTMLPTSVIIPPKPIFVAVSRTSIGVTDTVPLAVFREFSCWREEWVWLAGVGVWPDGAELRPRPVLSGLQHRTPSRHGKISYHKISLRVQVVLPGLINNPDLAKACRARVRDRNVNLPPLERYFVA